MLPDQVSNPGPLTYESGALPTALRGPAGSRCILIHNSCDAFLLFLPKLYLAFPWSGRLSLWSGLSLLWSY